MSMFCFVIIFFISFEPSHEIMVLFILHELILQTLMRSHPVGLDVWFLVEPFVYFHTSCVWTAMALARLRRCAGSPEPLLVAYVISTIISWAGPFILILEATHWLDKLLHIVVIVIIITELKLLKTFQFSASLILLDTRLPLVSNVS